MTTLYVPQELLEVGFTVSGELSASQLLLEVVYNKVVPSLLISQMVVEIGYRDVRTHDYVVETAKEETNGTYDYGTMYEEPTTSGTFDYGVMYDNNS